jgi:hypothetical protein
MQRYRFPAWFVARWLFSMLRMQRRNLRADARRLLAEHRIAVLGVEHIPRGAPFILVMNHYERAELGVWWPALLVTSVLPDTGGGAPVCWLITNRFYRFRLRGVRLPDPLVGWFLARVGARYGLILVARPPAAAMGRAVALRRARRALDATPARPIASTPEGDHASGPVLSRPVATSGLALAWLSRGEVPIVPVGVYEDAAGALTARFGTAFTLPRSRSRASQQMRDSIADAVMVAIAACLPAELRGPYAELVAREDAESR